VEQKDLNQLPLAQKEFIRPMKLTEDQGLILDEDKQLANLVRMNKGQASEAIELLKQLPKKPTAIPDTPVQAVETDADGSTKVDTESVAEKVPNGYFFIVDPTEKDPEKVEKFFRVNRGKEGTRWEGYVFLSAQASDDFYPVKDPGRREVIFQEILKDPTNAMNQYGLRIGRCGVCNRTLTDRHSILRGIGPICAARLEVEAAAPTEDQLDILRRLGLHD